MDHREVQEMQEADQRAEHIFARRRPGCDACSSVLSSQVGPGGMQSSERNDSNTTLWVPKTSSWGVQRRSGPTKGTYSVVGPQPEYTDTSKTFLPASTSKTR